MTEPKQTVGVSNEDLEAILAEHDLRLSVVSQVKGRWAEGQPLDARTFLDEHPELGTRKSIVLDLAYEEFCRRSEAGESLDADRYCRRFPTFEKSLRRLIEVHEFLDENSHLLPAMNVQWPEPGQTFEGFSILAELGRGAFARVFLAKEVALGDRPVAVKVSLDGAAEAEILGKLRHPNIVPIHSVRQDAQSGLTVVCMPYLGRVTLFDVLETLYAQPRSLTRARAILEAIRASAAESPPGGDDADPRLFRGSFVDGVVRLGTQLADALAYAHSRGICHSDLKPSNVLITPGGRPMLLDFNLAFDRKAVQHRPGGTLPYMSPEQLRAIAGSSNGESPAVGEPSDLFSLGVILYELLCGRLPFGSIPTNRSYAEIPTCLLERQESGPLPLREAKADVDPLLAHAVEGCLALDPAKRPQTAGELALALRRSQSPARKARRFARRHIGLLVGINICAWMICLGIGYRLATRDPYPVRMFNQGGKAFLQGRYGDAEEYFTRTIESAASGPLLADAFLARGRARIRLERYDEARADCLKAAQCGSGARALAAAAYAYACEELWRLCIFYSDQAIGGGFAEPEVYNNLGYSYLRTNLIDRAVECFDEAVKLDPTLQPALSNRALAKFRRALKERRFVDPSAALDVDEAIRLGPATPYLYLDAAAIYKRLGEAAEQHQEKIKAYLCHALSLGADPRRVRSDFSEFLDDPGVKGAIGLNVPVVERRIAHRLADPLAEEPFPFR